MLVNKLPIDILFKQYVSFDTCRYKNPLFFDFYINNKYLLEYDGKQHFE